MRNNILSLFLLVALPGGAFAAEAKILSMSGAVEVRPTREGQWTSASENMEIAEGGGIRTGAEGGAVVLMPNKTKVWLKEGTALEIEQRQTLASRLALVFGKIKVRVPHLMRKEKFEVRTPAAVCAVRGTEFTMGATEDGKTDVQVLFGEVKFKFTVPQAKGRSEFNIPQGQGLMSPDEGKPAKPVLLTAKQERAAMESWNPGLSAEQRQEGLLQKENDRAQIKDFARATASAENAVKGFLNVVKESDLEAGRTLRDVHGNVVRVDQRLMRPDDRTLQFFNLVKRPTYADFTGPAGGFTYNGDAMTERLDMARLEFVFNKDLPQRIEEWPGFFDGNDVRADRSAFIFANKSQGDDYIFTIAELYKYDAARDELVNNIKVVDPNATLTATTDRDVVITGFTDAAGLNKIAAGDVVDTGVGGGLKDGAANPLTGLRWAIKYTPLPGETGYYEQVGDPLLYQYSADAYVLGAGDSTNATNIIWLARENYVIDNSGGIKTVDDFTSSGLDPFSVLKETAGQTIMYVKKSLTGSPSWISNAAAYEAISDADYFTTLGAPPYGTGTNIDLVIVPDLALAAVQRMLPALSSMNE
ncbi:MAG TPA: hypothetical protein DCQ25_05235 [Elusimicrobia bacterium]|nr:hypothetical protein [Elusimicrobiota bacterium]